MDKAYKFPKRVHYVEDPPLCVTATWVGEQLKAFTWSPYSVLIFPQSLSSHDRHLCHSEAQRRGLYSKSLGARNDDRHIQVFKQDNQRGLECWGTAMQIGMVQIFETFHSKIFLGSGRDARYSQQLKTFSVTGVINCSEEWETDTEIISSVSFVDFPMPSKPTLEDEKRIRKTLQKTTQFIDNFEGCLLIHCVDGNTSSPVIAIAYLLEAKKLSLHESYNIILSKRPSVNIPSPLVKILVKMETEKNGFTTMTTLDWKKPEVIPKTPKIRQLSKVEIEDICLNLASLEILLSSVGEVCSGKYDTKFLSTFVAHALAVIEERSKQDSIVEWTCVKPHMERFLREWYYDRLTSDNDECGGEDFDDDDYGDDLYF
eukprot:TRINITY_DN22_c0_g2_i1.p1 TRINITY_DN22_c0_g2~~TRINITY_DN22_c0_g2_i1.p1  ORF type:complete len:372 (+),score=56.56 TRINITY_DN22_c0_g2_i1:29-1144(+)